ncbi:MAG: hypothetical protein PHR06_15730, partial [Candidatus Cloacimonetes bacterium]|nr:hypothetical protein [Candidatus Cloacimonadota bacterium]
MLKFILICLAIILFPLTIRADESLPNYQDIIPDSLSLEEIGFSDSLLSDIEFGNLLRKVEESFDRVIYLNLLKSALKHHPDSPLLRKKLGDYYFYYELLYDKADSIYSRIVEEHPSAEIFIRHAELKTKMYAFEAAENLYLNGIEMFPENTLLVENYFFFLEKYRTPKTAMRFLIDKFKTRHLNQSMLIELSEYYRETNQLYKTLSIYEKILADTSSAIDNLIYKIQ